MITITLNQIRNASPCSSGWKKVFKAHEHLGMDTPFPLSSVIESNDIADTLWCFNALDDLYVLKKFAILCAKEVMHLMTDPRSVTAIEVAERYIDGSATAEEMHGAVRATYDADNAAYAAAYTAYTTDAAYAATYATNAAYAAEEVMYKQKQILKELLDS